jgi:predicted MPP superfamily phosphohydrolase
LGKKTIILSVIAVLLILLIVWIIWSNVSIKVTHYTITSPKLPNNFDGFRIVQISDLHNTSFGKDNKRLLDTIRKASPDIIVITGDLIDFYHPNIEVSIAFIEDALNIAPCFYVNGNHEFRLTNEYPSFRNQLQQLGVTVLEDNSILYEIGGESICIAGLSDYAFVSTEFINATFQEQTYNILLSHRPDHYEAYKQSIADLVLCGHTHGGQIRLPLIGAVKAPGQSLFPEYDVGMFQLNDTTMIISQGLGNSSIPIRFNCQPEVVVIELTCS